VPGSELISCPDKKEFVIANLGKETTYKFDVRLTLVPTHVLYGGSLEVHVGYKLLKRDTFARADTAKNNHRRE